MSNAIITHLLASLNKAYKRGVKHPKMKLGRFEFALASPHSSNPGHAYITWSGIYMGKLSPEHVLTLTTGGEAYKDEIISVLVDVAAAASAYGRKTGKCCICGRELTAKESVAHSIGPICAEKYGLVFAPLPREPKKDNINLDIPEDF